MSRFGVDWTPTVLIVDAAGAERHRIEGFLPPDDFLAELHLGLGHLAFTEGKFEQAEEHFRDVTEHFPASDAAAEALYWTGVSKYKRTGEPGALADTAKAFRERYRDTNWAKKASVWAA